jgi:hypothetical protein
VSAGYSGTPLARKLGIKPEQRVVLRHAPTGWEIPDLPPGVRVANGTATEADLVLGFYRSRAELARDAPRVVAELPPASSWWVAWPRKAGGQTSDLTENALRDLLLPTGLVDVKVAAIDPDWSGLKFVWRLERRS